MDFSLTEEQSLLRDSVDKYIRDHCSVERHRALSATELAFDPAVWQQFAELGWLSVPFSEEDGGFGGGAVDTMVMTEALGKGLLREPYLSTVITAGAFLRIGATEQQRQRFIPAIIDGSTHWAFAFAESGSRYDLEAVASTATAVAEGYRLSGTKVAVLNGHCADFLVISARTSAADEQGAGLSLFIVEANAPGVKRSSFAAVDGSRGATIELQDVVVAADSRLGAIGEGLALMERVIDESIIAMGGEALAAMQVLLDATVEYTKTRQQFGQPIGKFQALQHRMADMYLKVEETRSLLFNAAIQVDEGSDEVAQACAALKVKIAEAGRFVSHESVQLHGGIGMTDELVVGHHFKRLLVLGMLYGDEDYYLQRYTRLS